MRIDILTHALSCNITCDTHSGRIVCTRECEFTDFTTSPVVVHAFTQNNPCSVAVSFSFLNRSLNFVWI